MLAPPCVRIHRRTSIMSLSLHLQQCPACLVCLIWMVFMMGGRWSYSCCFVGRCIQELFNIACSILVLFPSSFFSMHFISISVVHPLSCIDTTAAWKKLDRSNFHIISCLLIEVHAFAWSILTLLSVDETLQLKCVNLSTNFRGLPLRVEMILV